MNQPSHSSVPPVEVHDLTVSYDKKPVLWNIDVAIPEGQIVGIIGPNGAGKSTLIKAMMGLIPAESGWVRIYGEPLARQRHLVGYVPQRESVDWDFPVTVRDVVLMGTYGRLGLFRRPGKVERETCDRCLEQVGMASYGNRQIANLSGGQRQRVFLARALAQESRIYFMDEPFVGVDAATEAAIIELLRSLKNQKRTLLVVHHDLQTAADYFDSILMLNMRLVAFGPTSEVFTTELLQKTYGGRLTILAEAAEQVAGTRRESEHTVKRTGQNERCMGPEFFILAEATNGSLWGQVARFWSFQDRAVQTATAGMLLLAISSGTLGCFIVLRRLSLLGDSLGHAVLPGVCLGFMVHWTKDPLWILLGATGSALLASWMIGFIRRHSRLKPDAIMGLVLSGFFGVGTVLLTRIQNLPVGNQSGLNQFLFGQASAISEQDLWFMGTLSLVIVSCVVLAFKELVLTSFDEGFATAIGLPVRGLHYLLMGLTALAVVISIQAVGVVLVSAMLITPAATALLCTDRMRYMVLLAVGCAVLSGLIGLNLSFLGRTLPTGPFVVLALAVIFVAAYLFSPRYGIVARALRRFRQAQKTARENGLKSVFLASPHDAPERGVSLEALTKARREEPGATVRMVRALARRGWVRQEGNHVSLTEPGLTRARELDRNYRLWEQFLTDEVQLPADHTQRDAENLEHILEPDLVRELEARFQERHG